MKKYVIEFESWAAPHVFEKEIYNCFFSQYKRLSQSYITGGLAFEAAKMALKNELKNFNAVIVYPWDEDPCETGLKKIVTMIRNAIGLHKKEFNYKVIFKTKEDYAHFCLVWS